MVGKKSPKISVISPVYCVERFIGRAVKSMMEQTLDDVEFIFVDDCSTDGSIDTLQQILARYPDRAIHTRILRHNGNRGLPAARNTGLDAACGEYVFHWDSDDYAEPDLLENLYFEAVSKKCDYIWCDFFLTFNSNSRVLCQPSASTPREALSIMLAGGMKYNVWNKLVARRLYEENAIRFPDGYSMGEDMTMIKLLARAKRVGYVAKPLYHYVRTNTGAMTQIYSQRHLSELQHNTTAICGFLAAEIHDSAISKEINWFKLNVKLPFLFSGQPSDMKLWRQWYNEADRDIMSNRQQPLRTRLLQWTAAHRLSIVNTLYVIFVQKIIYGIIYR